MRLANVNSIDLNLLKAFYALGVERHVTKAGTMVGLSQSGMSQALSRLRGIFDDELFVRTKTGMVPTARCLALMPRVRQVLGDLDIALAAERAFNAADAEATFRIGMNDMLALLLLPPLLKEINQTAPGIDLRVIHTLSVLNNPRLNVDPLADLDVGRTDVAILKDFEAPARFDSEELFPVRYVCVSGAGNQGFNPPITKDAFLSHGHVTVTYSDVDVSFFDTALAERGLSRDIKVWVPLYSIAMAVAEQSNLVLSLPDILLNYALQHHHLTVSPLPVQSPESTYFLVWHKTRTSDPAHVWLREIIRQKCDELFLGVEAH